MNCNCNHKLANLSCEQFANQQLLSSVVLVTATPVRRMPGLRWCLLTILWRRNWTRREQLKTFGDFRSWQAATLMKPKPRSKELCVAEVWSQCLNSGMITQQSIGLCVCVGPNAASHRQVSLYWKYISVNICDTWESDLRMAGSAWLCLSGRTGGLFFTRSQCTAVCLERKPNLSNYRDLVSTSSIIVEMTTHQLYRRTSSSQCVQTALTTSRDPPQALYIANPPKKTTPRPGS